MTIRAQTDNDYERLAMVADLRGLRLELVAGQLRKSGSVEWRDITELRLTNRDGALVAREALTGIHDRIRAAGVILGVIA